MIDTLEVWRQRYPDSVVHPYFNSLLPEGEVRRMIAYDLGVDDADTFGLLAHWCPKRRR